MRRLRFAVAAITMVASSQSAHAAPPATSSTASCRAHAPEAAMRTGLAVDVILRVMLAESGGNPVIVSPKGAIGCMQIMPATWAYLSPRYGLGSDSYDARMNMIGGALYLAELARRFGWPGAYAAYNAGPVRYIRYAANGVPLPAETVAYAARLGGAAAPATAAIPRAPPDRAVKPVAAATQPARVEPRTYGWQGASQLFSYAPGGLYQVYAAVGQVTDIMLQEGETLSDTARSPPATPCAG